MSSKVQQKTLINLGEATNGSNKVAKSNGDNPKRQASSNSENNDVAASANLVDVFLNDPSLTDNEKKIITEFVHLLDKSKQLFNGLR